MTQRGAAVVGLTPVSSVSCPVCAPLCRVPLWSRGESTTGTISLTRFFMIMDMTPFCTSSIRDPS